MCKIESFIHMLNKMNDYYFNLDNMCVILGEKLQRSNKLFHFNKIRSDENLK